MQYTYLIWHIFIFVDMANNVWTKCLLHVCYGMMFFTVCSISLLCFTRYTLHHRKGPNLHCYKSDQVIPPRTDLKLGLSLLCTAGVRWRWASGSSRQRHHIQQVKEKISWLKQFQSNNLMFSKLHSFYAKVTDYWNLLK